MRCAYYAMQYDKTEIASTSYDKARTLEPETRRLWQNLLPFHIGRAAVSLDDVTGSYVLTT